MEVILVKRLVLFILITLFALVAGFLTFQPLTAIYIVSKGGYWVILITTVWLAYVFFKIIKSVDVVGIVFRRTHRLPIVLMGLGVVLFLVNEPIRYKVLNDELVLAGNSMRLHFDREFLTLGSAHSINGSLLSINGNVDKRPLFFVFVVSLVHDLTGYRSNNIFFVNGVLSFVCLALTYAFGFKLGGRRVGIIALLLLIGLPLLGQNATGAGFEILNLVMLLSACLFGVRYMGRRDDESLCAFVLTVVLLAQTRYESVLFVIAAAFVIFEVWRLERRVSLPWAVMLAPLLLILVPLQNKVFEVNPGYWQLPKGVLHPFDTVFYYDNVGHAVAFLFNVGERQTNSLVLSLLGVIGLVFFWMFVWTNRIKLLRVYPAVWILAAFGVVILANFFLLLCYHWGQLDQYVVSRLGLPLMLFMALSAGFVFCEFSRKANHWFAMICGILAIEIFAQTIPTEGKAILTREEVASEEMAWERSKIQRHQKEDVLYVLGAPLLAIIERVPAIAVNAAQRGKAGLRFHMQQGTYREILVFQRIALDIKDKKWKLTDNQVLDDDFVLETIDEHAVNVMLHIRLSRLVAIKPSKEPIKDVKSSDPNQPPLDLYYEEFYRNLPW